MKVLITGANGFLGSWLTKSLVEQGHEVFCLVRKNSDLSELTGIQCQYLYGDVTNYDSLVQAFIGIDTVFHLAGVIAYKKKDRQLMEMVNVQGTQNVINAMIASQVNKLVYLSSVVAIGSSMSPHQILDENSEYRIGHLDLGYFQTKHQAELLVRQATQSGQIQSVILNPSTIYGFGDAKKGSRKMQLKVAQGRFNFYTQGGVNVVAVEDVILGILSAWKKGKNGERYILSGENLTIKQLFQYIAEAAQVKPPEYCIPNFVLHTIGFIDDLLEKMNIHGPISRENAHTATMYHWFKNDKAKNELDFNPRPAKDAIKNSVTWMRQQGMIP